MVCARSSSGHCYPSRRAEGHEIQSGIQLRSRPHRGEPHAKGSYLPITFWPTEDAKTSVRSGYLSPPFRTGLI